MQRRSLKINYTTLDCLIKNNKLHVRHIEFLVHIVYYYIDTRVKKKNLKKKLSFVYI